MSLRTKDTNDGQLMGFEIVMKIGADVVAYGTSISIDSPSETIDVSNKQSGRYGAKKAGRMSYTVSFDGFNAYDGGGSVDLRELQASGSTVEWSLVPTPEYVANFSSDATGTTGFKIQKGTAIITNVGDAYGDQEASTYSCSLDGCGPIIFETLV